MSFDTDESVIAELEQYTANERSLAGQHNSIIKNLATKKARGQYKHDLAVKAFGYLVEAGAKKYAKDFSGIWHQIFPVPIRRKAAEGFVDSFEAEYKLGNYDYLLPKKYQKSEKTPPTHHARKKVSWRTPDGLKIAWSPVRQVWFALWPGRGRIEDQQVLKAADTDEMDAWLRETYGAEYGRAGGKRAHARKKSTHDRLHDPGALRSASDRQLKRFYTEEKRDAARAQKEASRRGLSLHARRKQLDREIAQVVPSWRGGR